MTFQDPRRTDPQLNQAWTDYYGQFPPTPRPRWDPRYYPPGWPGTSQSPPAPNPYQSPPWAPPQSPRAANPYQSPGWNPYQSPPPQSPPAPDFRHLGPGWQGWAGQMGYTGPDGGLRYQQAAAQAQQTPTEVRTGITGSWSRPGQMFAASRMMPSAQITQGHGVWGAMTMANDLNRALQQQAYRQQLGGWAPGQASRPAPAASGLPPQASPVQPLTGYNALLRDLALTLGF